MIFAFFSLSVTCHVARCGPGRLRSCLDTQHGEHCPSALQPRQTAAWKTGTTRPYWRSLERWVPCPREKMEGVNAFARPIV